MDFLEYLKKSAGVIQETLTYIDNVIFSELSDIEISLIAEFAATLSIKDWAARQGWVVEEECFRKNDVTRQDMRLIAGAHKAGAAYTEICLRGTESICVRFGSKLGFQVPDLTYRPNGDSFGVQLILEALKSGLELQALVLSHLSNQDMRLFFETLTTKVKLKKICMDRGGVHCGPFNAEILRLILSKSAALECLESLDLWHMNINNEHAELIAGALRAGAQIKSLNLTFNCIGDKGAMKLAKAIQAGVELKDLVLNCNYRIKSKGRAALAEAGRITGCKISCR